MSLCYRWREKFERKAGPNCKRRFLSGSCQYLESVIDEKRLNGCKESTLEEYHEFRRRNAGTTPFFALIEYARGIDLPDDVFNDDIFMSLYWTAVDVTAYSNVSFHEVPHQASDLHVHIPAHPTFSLLSAYNRTSIRIVGSAILVWEILTSCLSLCARRR